jgi:hypothetical protein
MENWQLTLVILGSVLVGALIPLLVRMGVTFSHASKEIADIGAQLKRTLNHVEIISDRVEVLSGGLKGGETNIADLLKSVGHIANGLERNMKTVNVLSTIMAALGTGVGAFVKTRFAAEGAGDSPMPEVAVVPGNGAPLPASPLSDLSTPE